MDLVIKEKLVLEERRISLSEFHTADEVDLFIYFFGISAVKIPNKFWLRTVGMYEELMDMFI